MRGKCGNSSQRQAPETPCLTATNLAPSHPTTSCLTLPELTDPTHWITLGDEPVRTASEMEEEQEVCCGDFT